MIARSIVIFIALLGSAMAHAQPSESVRATIFEYGIYAAEVLVPAIGSGTSLQPEGVTNICHVMTSLAVPTRDNVRFGLRYRIDGPSPDAPIIIKRVVSWPDHARPADAPVLYLTHESLVELRAGDQSWTGWRNIRSRPGVWMFRLLYKERILAELAFTLLDSAEVKIRPDSNSACFQMSAVGRGSVWRLS